LSKKSYFKNLYFHTNFRKIDNDFYQKFSRESQINFIYQRDLTSIETKFIFNLFSNSVNIDYNIDYILWYENKKDLIYFLSLNKNYLNKIVKNDTEIIISIKNSRNTIRIFNKD